MVESLDLVSTHVDNCLAVCMNLVKNEPVDPANPTANDAFITAIDEATCLNNCSGTNGQCVKGI